RNEAGLRMIRDVLAASGVPSRLVPGSRRRAKMLEIDMDTSAVRPEILRFLRRVMERGAVDEITISLYDVAIYQSSGFYMSGGRLELGPSSISSLTSSEVRSAALPHEG